MPTPFVRRPLLALLAWVALTSAPGSRALADPPILQSLEPAQAYPGSSVQLHGSGFGSALGPAAAKP